MVKYIGVLLLLFLGISFTPSGKLCAHVEKTYFLNGKVGARDIAIKMLCYDEMPVRHIHYFFTDEKRDRSLTGKYQDKVWNFIAEEGERKNLLKPNGTLRIRESANGSWTGWWIDSLGRDWDIILKPMITTAIFSPFNYLPYVNELDPYEYYRLAGIQFSSIKSEKLTNDLVAHWVVEKHSGISFFRMRSANNRLKTDSINAALETIHLSLIQQYFAYNPEKKDTKIETSFRYLTHELLSFQIRSTSTFHTGNSSQISQLSTLDLRSGEQVNLEDLIWFDKSENKPDPGDLFKIYKYRKNVFAPKIFNLLQELYPDKMKSDSCEINKMETWALPVWNLTNKGIAIGFNTPDRCDVLSWAVIPYEKLKSFMETKYHLTTTR